MRRDKTGFEARIAALTLAALTMLSACGGGDDTGGAVSSSSPAPETTTTAPSPTVAPKISPASTAPVETGPPPTSALSETPSADEVLATFTDEDIAAVGGIECATELALISSAGQRYFNDTGDAPESLDVLIDAGYITDELTHWALLGELLQPAPGSGCNDVFGAAAECSEEAERLTLARLAYLAAHPGSAEPTQLDLVEQGLLDEPSTRVDLIDGVVVPVPGGPCTAADLTVDWAVECEAARKTLEVAAEAYFAQNGRYPTSEAEVVPDLVRFDHPALDLLDGEVIEVPGGPCEGVEPPEPGPEECGPTRATLEVAVEAYFAQNGREPASEDELVGDFLREPSVAYDVVDGDVVAVAGGACEGQ